VCLKSEIYIESLFFFFTEGRGVNFRKSKSVLKGFKSTFKFVPHLGVVMQPTFEVRCAYITNNQTDINLRHNPRHNPQT